MPCGMTNPHDESSVPASMDELLDTALGASSVGAAFLLGYRGALRALIPGLRHAASLCATEAGGVHPRAIETTLRPGTAAGRSVLNGEKRWATGADGATTLLIVASEGSDDSGRNRLRVVQIPKNARGVSLEPMPPTPFIPQVRHFHVRLSQVEISTDALLLGDGFEDYLKPFRTLEDLYVLGALLSYLLGVATRHDWARTLREELMALRAAIRTLGREAPSAPHTHLALSGVLRMSQRLFDEVEPSWQALGQEALDVWKRDISLLAVASGVREQRTMVAWRSGSALRE
jgi:acyl-CoA dehydrogenase